MKSKRFILVGLILSAAFVAIACALTLLLVDHYRDVLFPRPKQPIELSENLTTIEVPGDVRFIAFSPDSKYLIAGMNSFFKWEANVFHGEIRVWELASKREVHVERFAMFIRSICFHPNEARVLIASSNEKDGKPGVQLPGQVTDYEFPTFRRLKRIDVGKCILPDGVKFSRDGKWIGVHKKDSFEHWDTEDVVIYDSRSYEEIAQVNSLNHMNAFEFTPDSKFIIGSNYREVNKHSNSYIGSGIDLFDIETGKRRNRFEAYGASNFEHVGSELLIPSAGTLFVYQADEKIVLRERNVPFGCHSQDGRFRLLIGYDARTANHPQRTEVTLKDLKKDEIIGKYVDGSGRICRPICSAFSPDARFFAVGRSAFRKVTPNEAPGPWTGDILLFKVPE